MRFAALIVTLLAAQDRGKEKPVTTMEAGEIVQWISRNSKAKLLLAESVLPRDRSVAAGPELLDPAFAFENGLKMLRSLGIAAVATDVPGVYELVPAPLAGKKVAKVYTAPDDLPKHEEFCTLTLRPRHLDCRNAQATLINLASFPQNCLADCASGTLILSDYVSNLRRMAAIVQQMDVPPPSPAFRISIAVLEATRGDDPDVPEEFKALELPKSTGFARFRKIGDTVSRFEARGAAVKVNPAEAVLRVAGPPNVRVELGGSERSREGLFLERFAVLLEKSDGSPAGISLQTRLELRGGGWVLVGVAPGESQLTSLVILARAVSDP